MSSIVTPREAAQQAGGSAFLSAGSEMVVDGRNFCDGRRLLSQIRSGAAAATFFDPQYRGVMDALSYGNEGARQKDRAALAQMSDEVIQEFMLEIDRILRPSGHLFLWIDKWHLCNGVKPWIAGTSLETVDLVTWSKGRMGMGYRTRRKSEYLMIFQKAPKRAKGVWTRHDIPDVVEEKITGKTHVHQKPLGLQMALIEAVTVSGDLVVDPCAGSFSVLDAVCAVGGRHFLGCDLADHAPATPQY